MKKLCIWAFVCILFGVSYTHAALKFNGGHINIPNGPVFSSTDALTISLWVKGPLPPHPSYLLAKSIDAKGGSFGFFTGATKGLQFYVTLDGVRKSSPDVGRSIWDMNPHFLVGIYDGSAVHLWVDGSEVGIGTPATGAITYNQNTMNIGMYDPKLYGGVFFGTLEDIRIWEVVVSTPTLTDLWLSKSTVETQENPLAWWKLKEVAVGTKADGYAIIDEVGDDYGVSVGNTVTGDDPLINDVIVATIPVTYYMLNQHQYNAAKERVWNEVFRKIANLDETFFVGVATGDWAANASSTTFHWVPVSVDTNTGVTCFLHTDDPHPSWTEAFKLNVINALLSETWDDVTFPQSEFDFLDDARKASISQ